MGQRRWVICMSLLALCACGAKSHPSAASSGQGDEASGGGNVTPGQLATTDFPVAAGGTPVSPGSNPPLVSTLFGDHMVIQHDNPVIFGWTTAGGEVTVQVVELPIQGNAVADANGRWSVTLAPLAVGGPYTINIAGPAAATATLQDVLAGEVWLSSGQSNSVVSLDDIRTGTYYVYSDAYVQKATNEIAAATNGNIRLLFIEQLEASTPQGLPAGGAWATCIPANAASFAATGYLFAQGLQAARQVPVGIIEASLGGTNLRQWVSSAGLSQVGNLTPFVGVGDADLYNGTIAPFAGYALAGVTWYQGEADASQTQDAPRYRDMLAALFGTWRQTMGLADLPFLVVQIANTGSLQTQPVEQDGYDGADIREAQLQAVQADARTQLVITIDIGDANTIHPPDKWDVGLRETAAAQALVYGVQAPATGPLFTSGEVSGSTYIAHFNQTASGMFVGQKPDMGAVSAVAGGALTGFAIAGADGTWYEGVATIADATVTATSPQVATPVAVRYGWAANPTCNLYNSAGFPASPFRSDDG